MLHGRARIFKANGENNNSRKIVKFDSKNSPVLDRPYPCRHHNYARDFTCVRRAFDPLEVFLSVRWLIVADFVACDSLSVELSCSESNYFAAVSSP